MSAPLPEDVHRRFVAEGKRADGRTAVERRKAWLQRAPLSSVHGSASARLGKSAAVAGVHGQVVEAVPDEPARGSIVVNIEMPALCSSLFRERSKQTALVTFLSTSLSEVLNSKIIFNPAQLDIKAGECYWVLHVDVVCLNYDGNAFDLCLLAAVAALEDTTLPALAEEPGTADVQSRLALAPAGCGAVVKEAQKVEFVSRPLPASFAQMPGEKWVLDPTCAEEAAGAAVSLCLVGGRWLVYHQGGSASAQMFLGEMMPTARSIAGALSDLLDAAAAVGEDGAAEEKGASMFGLAFQASGAL